MSLTRNRSLLLVPAAALTLVLLAGCSSDDVAATPESTTSATEAPAGQGGADAGQMGGQMGGGGTSGEIAAITDTVMQVQGDDGQTAVSWSDTTTITQTVAGTIADVTAGVCVVAITGSSDDETTTAATSIAISAPTDGECASGFGGGGGTGGEMPEGTAPTGLPDDASGDAPTAMPSGAPGDMPTGGAGMTGGFGGFTTGLVTAVSGTTITLEVTGQDDAVTTETVEVADTTTYTTTGAADATAIVVGQCVTAQGEADDKGQVASTSLVLSTPGDSGCSTGFGSGGRMGGDDA